MAPNAVPVPDARDAEIARLRMALTAALTEAEMLRAELARIRAQSNVLVRELGEIRTH